MKKTVLLFILISTVLTVCAQQPSQKEQKKMRKEIGLSENFVYIPNGDSSFWMLKTELSNDWYFEYLNLLEYSNQMETYQKAQMKGNFFDFYFSPAIKDFKDTNTFLRLFPITNISYDAAMEFCKSLNTMLKDTTWEFRLPTREEWMFAAKAGGYNIYSWSHPYLFNNNGIPMCNFLDIGAESIHLNDKGELEVVIDHSLERKKLQIVPAYCLYPNDWGLYNMCGNVAEMVLEKGIAVGGSCGDPGFDVQINSIQVYNGPSPKVGFRPILAKKKK
jgi:formylglycine-generating enzyme required for sulfatase activity